MHHESPTVVRLQIHLPDEQSIVFDQNEDAQDVIDRAASKDTTLTAYFKANSADLPEARVHLYQEFPQHFVWVKNRTQQTWKPRQRGFAIGRMYFAGPSAGERFYLRTLLTVVRGAKSFDDLRTLDGVVYPTFQAACLAHGLLEDDNEWEQCLEEAAVMQTGQQLRQLFATIIKENWPLKDPLALWNHFKEHICDDVRHKLIQKGIPDPSENQIYDYGLYLLNNILRGSAKSLADFPPMPQPVDDWDQLHGNRLIAEQRAYDQADQRHLAEPRIEAFNADQRSAFNAIMDSVLHNKGKLFFLTGPGGTGKTFVYNTLCYALRGQGIIVLCVASSGIAALLLLGGRTSHSTFKIPIELWEGKLCNIKKGSMLAELLCQVGLISWDEVPMQDRRAQEAVDKTMQDLRNDSRPFGGVTVAFGGDFDQILPVVVKGGREQVVALCMQRSYLWPKVEILYLTQNMRLGGANARQEDKDFAKWLLDVGSGRNIDPAGNIELPETMKLLSNTVPSLMDSIYPGIATIPANHDQDKYFLERTILSARNDDVDELNKMLLHKFQGEESVFNSADSVIREEGVDSEFEYPVEYLNSIRASGLPLSKLALKVGCPIMVLRNLDPANGLCNGSRGILTRMSSHVLEIRLLGGEHKGKKAFIPRITITPSLEQVAIAMKRRQFPSRLAFSMTINKAQGQSVDHVGLDLRTDVFAHGQLYVALSRCTSSQRVKVLFKNDNNRMTKNIVYPEVLLHPYVYLPF